MMIRKIIKDIIKKKSSKSDFESLVKNSNLESESIIEESDYTSITSKQKERINNILNMLQTPSDKFDEKVQNTYLEFKEISKKERILYSEITNRIFNIDDKEDGTILSNAEKLVDYADANMNENEDDIRCYRMICKFWDHCNLAYKQKELNKNTQESLNEQFKSYMEPYINDFKQSEKEMQTQYISILGIFAAIVLAFTGGMTLSASVLNNIHHASVYKLIIIACIVGLIFMFMMWLLMDFIRSIHGQLDRKYWVIIAFSITLIIIALAAFYCYNKDDRIDVDQVQTIEENNDTIYTD
ncbi:MAG: hypothetical protein ACLSGJ_10390 [Lachnospira eligens]